MVKHIVILEIDGSEYQRTCPCGTRFGSRHYGLDDCISYLHSRIAKLESILNVERED